MTDYSFESDQFELLARLLEAEGMGTTETIKPRPATAGVPLSFGQKRLWFLEQLEPGQPLYNVPAIFRLTGLLEVEALQQSFLTLVQRHTALCTALTTVAGQPQPIITTPSTFKLPITDLRTTPDREAVAQTLINAEIHRPFDLRQSPLLRASLLQLAEQEHVLILVIHHIATDGWSMGVLVRELATLYGAYTRHEPNPLPPLTLQYADFAHWQNEWLQSPAFAEQLAYWTTQLKGQPALLELATDHPRPAVQTFQGAQHRFEIPQPLAAALTDLSRQSEATLFMTLLAAFQTLLYRYTGQTDIAVGSPIAGRDYVELEPLVGFFINTLVLRSQFTGRWTFRQLLQHVREVTLGAYTHQGVPFEKLVEALQPERNLSHPPLFQVMFVLQNTPDEDSELVGLTWDIIPTTLEIAKFDLTLSVSETGPGLRGVFEYNTALFEPATLQRLTQHFIRLLESVVANPDQLLCHLPLLGAAEQALFQTWNATDNPYPHDQAVHQLFAAQAARTPTAVAVAYAQQTLSYQTLDTQANQLAHHLQALGVGPESLVAVCLERSLEVLVALLGVLKAGGAFVPIDPTYPPERLAFMLEDSGACILLTQQRLLTRLPAHTAQVVCLDTATDILAAQPVTLPPATITPTQLAYIIYTSGSTGRPKGAMITHHGLVNYLTWGLQSYRVAEGTGAPVHSSLAFDLTVTSLFMPLLAGKTVVMFHEDQGGATLSAALPAGANYSLLKLTPAHLEVLNQQLAPTVAQNCARVLIVGGEALWGSAVQFWQTHAPTMRIINEYGPTETVVGCCVYEVPANVAPSASLPIGYPIANTQLYVLDANFWPVPIGAIGELYIGGEGVGRGYWQRPSLTVEKFVPNPFSRTPGARLYKTGDLARYQPNGCLEYLGRTDNQVKLRGFRIELGEIEAAVRQHTGVQEAAVIVWDDATGKRLVAYLTLQAGATLTPGDLRTALKESLPEYMVPTSYVFLPELPLTPNGKVDRRALPPPEITRATLATSYVAPETEVEQTIATIWKECLRLERVGLHDNFFELGGHSLLLVQVHHQLSTALKREIAIVALFQHPTISALAKNLSQETPAAISVDRSKELASGKDRLKQLQQKQRAANTARKN